MAYRAACAPCHGDKGTGRNRLGPLVSVTLDSAIATFGIDPITGARPITIEKTRHGKFFNVGGVMPWFLRRRIGRHPVLPRARLLIPPSTIGGAATALAPAILFGLWVSACSSGATPAQPSDLSASEVVDAEPIEEEPLDGDMTVQVPRSFAEISEFVLRPQCASFPTCHSVRGATGPSALDLDTDPYRALVGVAAVQPLAAIDGLQRVHPCDPDVSFMWIKLDRFNPRYRDKDYGGPMPLDRPPVPAAQKQAIREWIARGAPREEPADGGATPCQSDASAPPDAP